MPTEQGYSNQKKKGTAQFKTIHNVGSDSFGTISIQKSLFDISLSDQAIVSVSDVIGYDGLVKYWNIEITAHGASEGQILRIVSGSLKNFEFEIISVVDADNLYVLPIASSKPTGEDARVFGWVTAQSNDEGMPIVAQGPTSYNLDGIPQTVDQDTSVAANNRALPSLNFIIKDGEQLPITVDSINAANTVALPVEIVATTGSPINITAGDINIQTTDVGAGFDSMRIGDGSGNYIGVNSSAEAKVHDADALSKQNEILNELKLKADLTETQPVSLASIPLASGAATSAKQDALLAELQLKADLTETQPVSLASIPLASGAATEAKQDTGNTSLSSIDGKIIEDGTVITSNSSTTPLGSNAVFTGTAFEVTKYSAINVGVYSDVASATNGVKVEFSPDGTNWDHSHSTTYTASSGVGYIFNCEFKYARVVYTNGSTAQGSFRLQTIAKKNFTKQSLYTIDQSISGNMFVELGKNVIIGKSTAGGGTFVDVKVNPSGALTVEASLSAGTNNIGDVDVASLPVSFNTGAADATTQRVVIASSQTVPVSAASLPLPTGATTEATLSAMSGKLPATLGQKTMANSLAVTLASDQTSIKTAQTNSKGEFIRNDYTSASVTTSAYTQLIASTSATYSALEIFDSSGQTLKLAIGGAGSEVDQFLIFAGGNGRIPFTIASGSRISIRAVSATANSGEICINFYV